MKFGISLAVRNVSGTLASKFSFRHVPELDAHGVDIARDDILHNVVSREDQLTNKSTPWRGPREKSVLLMQMLIEACSFLRGYYSRLHGNDRYVFVIFYFSWLSIHACRNVYRRIAALEADENIFQALLAPLIIYRTTSEATLEDRATNVEDHEGEDIPVKRIVKRSRFTK